MSYLESIGKSAKKAFEDLKGVKHKKIKKVLENYNQSLLKNTNELIKENSKDVLYGKAQWFMADDKVKSSRKISTFSSDYNWVTESLGAEDGWK